MCDCHFRDSQSESENEESQEEVPAKPASAVELHLSQIDGRRVLFRENLILMHVNNESADQAAHMCSLISTFIAHSLESIIAEFDTCEISVFY